MRLSTIVCAAFVLVAGGCASTPSQPRSGGHTTEFITASEIAESGSSNAYEVIARVRPTWLRARGTASIANGNSQDLMIAVYMDGHRLGDLATLRMLSTSGIASMQWLDAARAQTILPGIGSDPIAGAIVIKSR